MSFESFFMYAFHLTQACISWKFCKRNPGNKKLLFINCPIIRDDSHWNVVIYFVVHVHSIFIFCVTRCINCIMIFRVLSESSWESIYVNSMHERSSLQWIRSVFSINWCFLYGNYLDGNYFVTGQTPDCLWRWGAAHMESICGHPFSLHDTIIKSH